MSRKRAICQILKLASVYIGTVIGAGFASGQEMITFFTRFGLKGVWGLVLAGIGYALIGSILLELVYERKYTSYQALLKDVMGKRLAYVLEWTVNIFLFVCFTAMIAGAGAILNQAFGLNYWIGAIAMAIGAMMTFLSGAKGFIRMNLVLVPFMCIGGILLGLYIILFRDVSVFSISGKALTRNWMVSALLYVSYNTLTVVVVLCTLYHQIYSKKMARISGILGGLGLGLLGLSIGVSTLIYYDFIKDLEIPMLGVLLHYPNIIKIIYLIVLILAMYTTAIANGYGVVENLKYATPLKSTTIIVTITILGILGAKVGFSNMVAGVFPIFGYIGLFEILMILVYYSFMKWDHRRKESGAPHRKKE